MNPPQARISTAPIGLYPNELAQRWRCNRMTIYRQIKSGNLKTFRVGGKHLIPFNEIERHEEVAA